jgi:cytidylate kinase
MSVITVSRQLGSDGDRLAVRVAEAMGYKLVDRRLVEDIARITGATSEEVERFDEKGEGRIQCFLRRLLVPEFSSGAVPIRTTGYLPEFGLEFPYLIDDRIHSTAPYLDRGTYQLLITTLVQDAGTAGNVVVVGRASQVILRAQVDVVHIKVIAATALRCERVVESRHVSSAAAAHLVEQHDRWRKLYLRNGHGVDWDDPLLYDLVINTGRMTEEDAVNLLTGLLQRRGTAA